MKIKKESVLDFSELFSEAKKRLNWEWNKCCTIFHGGEIICSPENPNSKIIYLDDMDYYEEEAKKGDEYAIARKLIFDLMIENNLDQLRIVTD